jgi:flagellar biosynthesis protein FlhG
MSDQADKLRALIQTATDAPVGDSAHVPMVVVAGARAGVGATTVAVNLAAAMADRGERVLVVDAAEHVNRLAELAGVEPGFEKTIADAMSGECSVADAMVDGAMGMRVLASRSRRAGADDFSRQAQQRLLNELDALSDGVDSIIVDAGHGLTPWTRRFWLRARLVVLVSTAEVAAVLDAYAAMKHCSLEAIRPTVRLLVNQSGSDSAVSEVKRRMDSACRQFLSLSVEALPSLPPGGYDAVAGARAPRVWEAPNTAFGRAVLWLGRAVSNLIAERNEDAGCRGQGFDVMPAALVPESFVRGTKFGNKQIQNEIV